MYMIETTIVVPARLESSRFPRKVLTPLGGIPVLRRVLSRVSGLQSVSRIVALVDHEEVSESVRSWGFESIMTSPQCNSGIERIVSVKDQISSEFIINVQGDEPFVSLEFLTQMIDLAENCHYLIYTGAFPLKDQKELFNPNRVKVVLNSEDCAMYFSRSVIPFIRDESDVQFWSEKFPFLGHLGIYGYRRDFLDQYSSLKPSNLESIERLEQLRFLENQYKIKVIKTFEASFGIDTPEDLIRAEQLISQ